LSNVFPANYLFAIVGKLFNVFRLEGAVVNVENPEAAGGKGLDVVKIADRRRCVWMVGYKKGNPIRLGISLSAL
jgi:hypothetical protein